MRTTALRCVVRPLDLETRVVCFIIFWLLHNNIWNCFALPIQNTYVDNVDYI